MSKLLEQLKYWRAERPDEWKMDEFFRLAEEQNKRIAELEKKLESYDEEIMALEAECDTLVCESDFLDCKNKLRKIEYNQAIRDLEQQVKGVGDFLLDANTDYESMDFKYWSFNSDYTSKYLCDLHQQAKQLKEQNK